MNHRPFFTVEHPIAMAHRGGAALWPENTLPAFRGAVGLGYRFIETDLRATRDGVLVCLHDSTLDRTTDATGLLARRTWAELEEVDAAHHFRPEEDFPWRGKGVRIPSLEEVVSELSETFFTLELKEDGLEEPLLELVERLDLWDRVLVGSFRDQRLAAVRRLSGGRLAISAGERETTRLWLAARVGRALRTASDALQVPIRHGRVRVVDRRMVRAAHAAGKQVHVWTVDDELTMRMLLQLGVDGLITDRPDVLREVLKDPAVGG